jgi:recombinational DNA repair ATPase RecF
MHDNNAARERLEQIRIENEVRAQSFELREKDFETAAREREKALADSRDHLLSTLRMRESDRATLRAWEARIAALEAQMEDYRRQLARVIERAVSRNRKLLARKPRPATRPKPRLKAKRRVTPKKSVSRAPLRGRSKR